MISLQRRLSIALAGILLVAGLLLIKSSLWLFDSAMRHYLQNDLRDEAQSLLGAVREGHLGLLLDDRRIDPSFQRPYSGRYFRIDFADTTWRSRSLWDAQLAVAQQPAMQPELVDGPQQQRLLVWRGDYQRFGQSLVITVAQDYTPVLYNLRRVQWLFAAIGGMTLLLVLCLQRWAVQRALRPLEQVRGQVRQLQEGQRTQLHDQVPVELLPLVQQVNGLLRQTEQSLQRSRTALGNLGHALKTPLAVLFNLLHRQPLAQEPMLQAELREHLQQIEQRMARELGRARLAGDVLPGAHFDCGAELPALLDTLRMVHGQRVQLAWQAPQGLRVAVDREDLLELLGNLLDNACKWARQRVELSLTPGADALLICVDDDGPGIAEDKRAEVLGRGNRLDEQVAGHGLGLAIVRDIAESWGASLQLLDSPLGGLQVRLLIPSRRT